MPTQRARYAHSIFMKPHASFEQRSCLMSRRLANAGSSFKNPVVNREAFCHLHQQLPDLKAYPQANGDYKLAAGWLIDQCGWKGYRKGAVGIHHRHALVLVNYGGARATDLLGLAKQIQDTVALRYNVSLEVEPDHFF